MITKDKLVFHLETRQIVDLWNVFCEENKWYGDEIYTNDQYGLEMEFTGVEALQDLARAIHNGSYEYTDRYFKIDGGGHIATFDMVEHIIENIDIDEMVEWLNGDHVPYNIKEELENIYDEDDDL